MAHEILAFPVTGTGTVVAIWAFGADLVVWMHSTDSTAVKNIKSALADEE